MKMKHLFLAVAASVLAVPPILAQEESRNDDVAQLLKEGAATIHHVWTEWMEKPKLTDTKISEETLKSLHGTWSGSYTDDEEKIELSLALQPDGRWICEAFRPEMNDGHYYLSDGMLLLFESEISDDSALASALALSEGKLRLLIADSEAGFAELTKAERGGVDPTATAVGSKSEDPD
jgi:hypothetical protein